MTFISVGPSLRNTLKQIFHSAFGSALWALFSSIILLFGHRTGKLTLITTLSIPIWYFILSHIVLILLVVFFLWIRQRKGLEHSHWGRDNAMMHNISILLSRHDIPPETSKILSTRFMSWPIAENSLVRTSFRQEIDSAIQIENREVLRLWVIRNQEDARRLLAVIDKHQGKKNHSIRVFFDLPPYLPEVLVVNSRKASLSFSQPRNPSELEASLVITDKQTISIVEEYFETLWEGAERLFEHGSIVKGDSLDKLNVKAGVAQSA